MTTEDPFDTLFTLEDTYHAEGHAAGVADGRRQARLEARLFGIEKGFEKFSELGILQAKVHFWSRKATKDSTVSSHAANVATSRVARHLDTLTALVEYRTLSTANTDEAVAEFDDRVKRAQAKIKVVERLMGQEMVHPQTSSGSPTAGAPKASVNGNIEDFGT